MSKTAKIWLIIATISLFLGTAICLGAILYSGGSFDKISTTKYQTNTFDISESFNSISVDVSTADIEFIVSETGECKVECFEQKNLTHNVEVLNGVLNISNTDNRTWRDFFGLNFKSSKVKVYLPSSEYQNVIINASTSDVNICQGFTFNSVQIAVTTGDVNVKNVNALEDFIISVTTGDVNVRNVTAKKFTSKGDTGDVYLYNVVAVEHITIERSTGDVEFESIDAPNIFIKTSTGDVEGSVKTGKTFNAKSSTGRVRVPSSTEGGTFVIETDTGDIRVIVSNN